MADKKIGWIGTGVMGRSMCLNVQNQGYPIHVVTRTRQKAEELINAGATWCDSPAEIARETDLIFSIVGYPSDVREVMLGPDGVVSHAKEGSVIVDMSTSEPSLAQAVYKQAQERGISVLDAPVSGGDIGARQGTLAIMVGGDRESFDRVTPFLEIMGENIAFMGPAGSGQHTKMSNQILIASTMIGVVESLIYGLRAGLDPDEIIDVIGKGAAACWSINNLGRRIVKKNFDPGFFVKHFVKDMGIALAEARAMNLSLPGLALANQFYVSAMAIGHENLGTQSLYKVYEELNGRSN